MSAIGWGLTTRMLVRDWRAGETVILAVALVVSVAAMSAVGLFTNRVRQAVTQQAGEVLAADLRLESDNPLTPEYLRLAAERGLQTAEVVHFRSVILAGVEGFKSLKEGQKVTMEVTQGQKGPQAENVLAAE